MHPERLILRIRSEACTAEPTQTKILPGTVNPFVLYPKYHLRVEKVIFEGGKYQEIAGC